MDIKKYYRADFANDLHQLKDRGGLFFNELFQRWETPVDWPSRLPDFRPERMACFLLCFYFTALVKQAFYTYCRDDFQRFEKLTRYPHQSYVGLGRTHASGQSRSCCF
jgi:hypothetical protein